MNKEKRNSDILKVNIEERLNARAVSRGFAVGKVICLHGRKRQFYRVGLKDSEIQPELRRFRRAVGLAANQLKKIAAQKSGRISESRTGIFSAHLLILEDDSFHSKIKTVIENQKVNAEWAVKVVSEEYVAQYKTIPDQHLRERYVDLEDVADRILTTLGGDGKSPMMLEKNSIIVAEEVRPSTLIELVKSQPQAIITENGGWTSHTFILAREMNLPAVTGVKKILRRVENGDRVIVDGFGGQVILHPRPKTIKSYTNAAEELYESKIVGAAAAAAANELPRTLDNREIIIRANVDLPKGYALAKKLGAKGVGLYRSEILFNQHKNFPGEREQIAAYRAIAEMVGADGVRIRTFDLSVEQLADETAAREKNPALGLRAIRLGLAHLKEFRLQLRALLQAATSGNIHVVLPMVSDVSEIRRTKTLLKREKESLRRKKIEFGNLQLGAMIEVPSAIFVIEEIVREADFLCLGTNDLVQYLLAADRDNESVADWFRTLHPSVLRAVKIILTAAEKKGIPVIVCGEMAGSPAYVPILLGLGATEMSMNGNSIERVKKVVTEIALEEARELVATLEDCQTADEVENAVTRFYQEKWSHLFFKDVFSSKKNYKI